MSTSQFMTSSQQTIPISTAQCLNNLTPAINSTIVNGIVQQQLQHISIDETPNKLVYRRVETIVELMQNLDATGVPIRTVKSFMSKIPSVFTGTDLIQWILKRMDVEDTLEALHFAHLVASHGYMFPIDDHILTVKNDGSFFRFQVITYFPCENMDPVIEIIIFFVNLFFQTPYYWPSNNAEPENTDYGMFLIVENSSGFNFFKFFAVN